MVLPDDDELYEVDQTYLGPRGRYIAPMRHKAIFAWLVIAPMTYVLLQRIGLPMTLLTGGLAFLFTLWAAMKVADHATSESPVTAILRTFWHELTAPRPNDRRLTACGEGYQRAIRPEGTWGRYLRRQGRYAQHSVQS